MGTIRYNLDPFDVHSDEQVWRALEHAHIQKAISALPDGLQTEVTENGANFRFGAEGSSFASTKSFY